MSSNTNRITLDEARALAGLLMGRLAPHCKTIQIVGSVRRQRPTIGDIELLIAPIRDEAFDLFGQVATDTHDHTHDAITRQQHAWDLTPRHDAHGKTKWGLKYKAAQFRGFPVDLFFVTEPAQWGVISLLRTGSADWAHRLVTPVEQDCFNRDSRKHLGKGWMPAGLFCHKGAICRANTGEIIPTPHEQDVFDLLAQRYVAPEDREIP